MKLTNKFFLTATAVAVMASSAANAKTVFEDDTSYLNLTGEVAFEMVQSAKEDQHIDSKTDNVDLEVKAGYKLDNGVEVYAWYAFEFAGLSEEQGGKDFLKDHWIGVKKDGLEFKFGDFDYSIDRFGIAKELDAYNANDSVGNPDDSDSDGSKSVLEVQYKTDAFYVAASFDPKLDSDATDEETSYDIFAKVKVADGLTIGAVYSFQEYYDGGTNGDETYDQTAYGVQIKYNPEDLYLGASYIYGDRDGDAEDASGIDLAVGYKVSSKVKVAAGIAIVSYDEDSDDNFNEMYVNANYNFVKNLDVYGEVYGNDKDNTDTGLLLGLSLDF